MRSNASGAVSFKYGTFVNNNGAYGNTFTVVGDADAESTYDPNGTITIVLSRSKIGSPAPGTNLQGFLIRVRIDPAGVTPDNMPDSLAPEGVYTIVGNDFCRPNTAPLADLQVNPQSGPAPLTVNFDASASSDSDADAIASYTFTFGDGSPDVTQATPTTQHTYTAESNYLARVVVKDSRGKESENAAVKMIDVGPAGGPTPTPTSTPTATATATASPSATATATASPSATATASPIATPTSTPTATATATGTPTSTPSGTPTATPTASPTPARLLNISSRLRVQTGDNVLIGGFIVDGLTPKRIIVRAIGPSITVNGTPLAGRLADPVLELYNESNQLIASNDNWKNQTVPADKTEIEGSGLAPTDDNEPAISRIINPGEYTAIVRGKNNTTGIALVEVYDRNADTDSKFANISTRGFVESGDNVLIGGFILGSQNGNARILTRSIGPSLKPGLAQAMDDPTLELFDQNGTSMATNDNWKDAPNRAEIEATGLAPTKDAESAILMSVPPTPYTAIVRGKNNTTGIALVELYNVP
jgi:PKD repeat protein